MRHRKGIPNLGIGVGLRPAHYEEIFASWPQVDWFEVISEHFLEGGWETLEPIVQRYPVVLHGVSMAIGGPDPLDFDYLHKLKALARKTKTPWISDHLSWGRLAGAHYHDLLPLPYRREVVDFVAERARIVQDFLEVPFALENISSYMGFQGDEMPEWEFYAEVVEKANIFMMLDVNNIYVSGRNQGFDPKDYYQHLPLERVIQIHLAGHTDYGSHCLDTHDRPVCDAVWKLYAEIYPLAPVSTLLEWDEHFISFADTQAEALKAKAFQREIVGA